jgi:4-amino-4-deoxy-L-arabinose transferase-like glycosyltransferase
MKARRLLLAVVLGAILLRLPVAVLMGDQVTVLPAVHDQISYDALARSLLAGRGYQFPEDWYPFTPAETPTAHWSFAYPLYLAGVYSLTGYHPLAARILQAVVGSALIAILLYLIGRRVASEAVGLAAAALAAVYGYFVYYSAALMTETFFIVLVLAALYLCLALRERPTIAGWLSLGLALGLATLLRQTALLLVPFLLLWLVWELRKSRVAWWSYTLPLIVMGLLIAPWTIRNYRVFDHFLLLNSNAGYAIYASSNPSLGSDWRNDRVVVPVPPELAGRNEAELDQALTRQAIKIIIADPLRYLRLSLDKSLEYFKFWPSADSSRISNINRVLSFGLFLPFMALGLFFSLTEWRRFLPLYLFMVVHTAIYLLTWPSPRYRLPVDAVLLLFAGLALHELVRRVSARRREHSPVPARL